MNVQQKLGTYTDEILPDPDMQDTAKKILK